MADRGQVLRPHWPERVARYRPHGPQGCRPTEPAPDEVTPEPDTFLRAAVKELRRENADHRARAARADEASNELVEAYAAGAGLLPYPSDLARYADPADLVDEDGLPDPTRPGSARLSRRRHRAVALAHRRFRRL